MIRDRSKTNMFYYKVIHRYKLNDRNEEKEIGIFSSESKASEAINMVKNKPGFVDYQDGFIIEKRIKLFKPTLLDYIYWSDGFDTYYFHGNAKIYCDEGKSLMKYFSFLLTEYNFKFDKLDLGDWVNENGKLWCYGPYNCYYFYNDKVCINFMNLVQKGDWNVYITQEVLSDQNLIRKGKALPGNLCYNWSLLASMIKEELARSNSIFEVPLN